MRLLLLNLFALLATYAVVYGQTSVGMVAYYTFDSTFQDVTGNTSNAGTPVGNPEFRCGVQGQALFLDGINDQVTIMGGSGNVNSEFDTENFTVSFYFKPIGENGTPFIISKRSPDCINENNQFLIRYAPGARGVNAVLIENENKGISLVENLNNSTCWQHVLVLRRNTRVEMYINGEFARDLGTLSRIDLENNGNLIVGGGNCRTPNEPLFHGLIDELRIYNRALTADEIKGLHFAPDMIQSRDTLIFLGNSVDIEVNDFCPSQYTWAPAADVFMADEAEPVITPSQTGTTVYTLEVSDDLTTCIARDSIQITVVDPSTLECDELYLPKAFTPNNDALNDTYGISNPFAIQELITFEIFDRWGSRMFVTSDPFGQWDGSFQGKAVNPGVMLYKIRYVCNDVQRIKTGSLTLLR